MSMGKDHASPSEMDAAWSKESPSGMCLEEELHRSWKFVFDAPHTCLHHTKLRMPPACLHGVSEKSRLYEPQASTMHNLYFRNLSDESTLKWTQ